jgi:hypothetical protein
MADCYEATAIGLAACVLGLFNSWDREFETRSVRVCVFASFTWLGMDKSHVQGGMQNV